MRRIKQITITNLFGMFNYVIPLHLDDRITIIHGPNGFGKTIILKLLSEIFPYILLDAFDARYHPTLRTVPFDQLIIDFDDGISFQLTKSFKTYSSTTLNLPVEVRLASQSTFQISQITFQLITSTIEQTILGIEYTGPYTWEYHPIDVLKRSLQEPDWLIKIRSSVFIHLIETERLSSIANSEDENDTEEKLDILEPTVMIHSTELTEAIKTKLAESVALAQSLDRTFPVRVVNLGTRSGNMTDVMLRKKLADLEHKRSLLIATGLLDGDDDTNFQVGDQIDDSAKTALSIYVEDTEKKLAIFDEMANKIDLLKRIVNKRFLYKEMSISRKNGFIFTTSNGASLAPTDLSSGEQHELVLFYELLFKVAPGSLILIDEPELSLHVVWQEHFLHDVQEITKLSDIDVLLATHSPDLISDRRDLVVELEGSK